MRPSLTPRKLGDCRPTGHRRTVRVALARIVTMTAVACVPLLAVFGLEVNRPITIGYLVLVAVGAWFSLRGGPTATVLAGLGALVTGLTAASDAVDALRDANHAATHVYLTGTLVLAAAGLALALGDVLLHALERRFLVREVDPVVATARVLRR